MKHRSAALCSRICTIALLAASASLVTGCGSAALQNGVSDVHDMALPALQGRAFGGQQPISGGLVQLWAVGLPATGGSYGGGQVALISSTLTTSDGTGASNSNANAGNANNSLPLGVFTITHDYSCASDSYVYLTITGGDSGGGPNHAINLMAALGPCSNLAAPDYFVNVSEASTIAGVFALQQFATATFGTAGSFSVGAPSTNVTGLQNAFKAVNNLVNIETGAIPASTTNTATVNSVSVSVVTTSENTKIAQLANILAYCVNSADQEGGVLSANCSNLFAAVKPAGQTNAPADTLQAALDLAINPTNVGSSTAPPFNLVSPQPPFSPNLGSTPPNDWTLGLSYSSTSTFSSPSTYNFLSKAFDVAIDSVGDIYVLNAPGSTTSNSVGVIGPDGLPVKSVLNGTALSTPRGLALDTNDVPWVANTGANATALVGNVGGTPTSYAGTGTTVLYGVAVDGANNVFAISSTSNMLEELTGGTGSLASIANTGSTPERFAIDASYNIWIANSAANTVTKAGASCTSTPCTYPAGSRATYTGLTNDFGIAIDKNGIPWISDTSGNEIASINPAVVTSGGTFSAASLGGLTNPLFTAMDGSSNLWVVNNNTTSNSVSEIAAGSTTVALSPSTGFKHAFATPRAIAIDQSGNVWVASSAGSTAAAAPPLTEIVGAGTPAVQPLSKAIALGKVGQAP